MIGIVVMNDVDVQDTPYYAFQCSESTWAIYCTEHRIVFPVEITEPGPLFDVPWNEMDIDELPHDVRNLVESYAQYRNAKVAGEGCAH